MRSRPLITLLLLCLGLALAPRGEAVQQTANEPPPSLAQWEYLVGETLEYEIGFLWFDRLAAGRLSFDHGPEEGTFRAILHARTLGLAAAFTRNREETYVSIMEVGPDGFLRPKSFTTRRFKGSGEDRSDRAKDLQFDFASRQVTYRKFENDKLTHESLREMPPEGELFDLLSSYWNFRMGKFGALEPGKRYVIPSFSFKGYSEIVIQTLSPEAQAEHDFFPAQGGLFFTAEVDRELFETGGGKLYVWLDEVGRPQRGIIEDILGIGDVRGVMVKKYYRGPAATREPPAVIRTPPPPAAGR